MQKHKTAGFFVALLLISGVTSQFVLNQAFAQSGEHVKSSKKTQVSESKYERKQAARQAAPISSQDVDKTKFEHKQELRSKQQFEKQVANVKTSFQLKQEAKNNHYRNKHHPQFF